MPQSQYDGPSEIRLSNETDRHSSQSRARAQLLAVLRRVRPERAAGGYSRDDGTVQFFMRVNALLSSEATLLDFGAGRGRQFDMPNPGFPEELQKFQGKVARVIGTDVYDGVLHHPYLDERHVTRPSQPLPLPDASVDIVVADWVFEHLKDPKQFVSEMERIVRPGGWICARTVNKWGYVGVGARLLPNAIHRSVVRKLIPVAKVEDVFPTYYRLNTLRDIRRWFTPRTWENYAYLTNTTPRYFGNSWLLFRLADLYHRVVPTVFSTDLFVFIRRRL